MTDEELANRIEGRLKALNRSPITAALMGGLERTYLRDLLTRKKRSVKRSAYTAIAKGLDWTEDDLIAVATVPLRVIRPAGPEASEVEKIGEGWPDAGDEWMDLRGVVEGGSDGSFEFGNVIDQVRRPAGLRKARHVAALNVAGESMVPRFRPGELIYVHQRLAAPGDDIVVELHPEIEGESPKAFLKEFVRKTGHRLYCRQHNPASDIEFDAGEVRTIWRVVPLRELLF